MSESSYRAVRGHERGLAVLRTVNALGEATSIEVARITQLPRPTVHRLLETLRRGGYLYRNGLRDAYRLTLKVKSLSDGYKDDDWVTEIAAPVLAELFEEAVWPTDIATYDDGCMVIRATTHQRSPLSIERAWVGLQSPMLSSAVGKTYLAFAPAKERNAILERLAASDGLDREKMKRPQEVERMLKTTRARGYGSRQRELIAKTSSIAVPIMDGRRVLACVNIVWIDSALKFETAVKRYLPMLQKTAAKIEAEYLKMAAR
jgi:IclR family mhp operon transcriptional activator